MQYCSLQHETLLSPRDTSAAGHRFHFAPAASFFLELSLCSSPVAYGTLTDLGALCSGVLYVLQSMGLQRGEHELATEEQQPFH